MIRNVVFNLQDTYITGLESFLLSADFHIPKDYIDWLYRKEITEKSFWEHVIGFYDIDYVNSLKRQVRGSFTEIEGSAEYVMKLRRKGYNVGLISDHCEEWIDYISENFDLERLFPKRCYSFEIGRLKSDPMAWSPAFEKLCMQPDETHLIDKSETNLRAAIEGPAQVRSGHVYKGTPEVVHI